MQRGGRARHLPPSRRLRLVARRALLPSRAPRGVARASVLPSGPPGARVLPSAFAPPSSLLPSDLPMGVVAARSPSRARDARISRHRVVASRPLRTLPYWCARSLSRRPSSLLVPPRPRAPGSAQVVGECRAEREAERVAVVEVVMHAGVERERAREQRRARGRADALRVPGTDGALGWCVRFQVVHHVRVQGQGLQRHIC